MEQISKIQANTIIYGFILFWDAFIIQPRCRVGTLTVSDDSTGISYWTFHSPLLLVIESYLSEPDTL